MGLIFDKVKPLAFKIAKVLEECSSEINDSDLKSYDWYNKVFTSSNFRRAHVELLEKNNMLILHVTIFPHLDDSSPIFGFDIVCTNNKVSGIFHDFSITVDSNHVLQQKFVDNVIKLSWKKERELPEWGKKIFSNNMIAAGGSNTEEELNQIVDICLLNLNVYLELVGKTRLVTSTIKDKHNYYCKCQKENPYPVKMLTVFGLTEDRAKAFVNYHLFPEV
jgi:hypothetical protein